MHKPALALLFLTSLSHAALAQGPPPSPIPQVAPRAAWVNAAATGNPSQRRDNLGAASDTHFYVFGGYSGNATTTTLNALYEFNGTAWTLKTAEGAVGSPSPRGRCAVAWDFTRNKLVVFGGNIGGATQGLLDETWEWDPTTNAWTNVTPPSGNPSPRQWPAMAWDPMTGGMIMFGGDTGITPSAPAADTWLFISGVWIPLSTATTPPARRQHHVMTRRDFGDIFLCGGIDPTTSPQTPFLDTWRWNGADWVQIVPTTAVIPASVNANQAVYDEVRRRVVMQGGQGIGTVDPVFSAYGGSPTNWCSEFDCVTNEWKLYGAAAFGTTNPVIGRASRYYAAFVSSLGKVYKFGGQDPSSGGPRVLTYHYQSDPVASATNGTAGCGGLTIGGVAPNDAPWTTRNFVYAASGLAAGSIALHGIGFNTQSLPLSALLPIGIPGCTLDITLDISFGLPVIGGVSTNSLVLPDVPALAGATLHFQVLEINATFTSLTSTPRLTAVVGAM
ncbi:MAG: kelch repeat-containing protein [Planctomycetota bacterium]